VIQNRTLELFILHSAYLAILTQVVAFGDKLLHSESYLDAAEIIKEENLPGQSGGTIKCDTTCRPGVSWLLILVLILSSGTVTLLTLCGLRHFPD
jgi:hypothetical protein